jgi:hypothetical protein
MNKKVPEFKITKILDHGTSNPIVNRMSLQFFDILGRNLIDLSEQRIEEVKKYLFECMKDLIKAEESKNAYMTVENQAIQRVMSKEGVQFQPHAFSYEDPTENLKKHFEDFLIRCVICIRKVVKIAEVVFLKSFDGPKDLKRHLSTLFPDSSSEIKMIEEDSVWIKELYDLRGKVEHDELVIAPFDIAISNDGKPLIKIPRLLPSGAPIREYLKITLENCFTFVEDMTAMLLNTCCSKEVQIVLAPDNLRPNYRGFKYVLDLKGEYKEKLLDAIKKAKTTPNSG